MIDKVKIGEHPADLMGDQGPAPVRRTPARLTDPTAGAREILPAWAILMLCPDSSTHAPDKKRSCTSSSPD
jgi:hypothetical protein